MELSISREISQFIGKQIGTQDFECLKLAGDASTRKYYRVVYGDQSLVLMSWEPFKETENYPFLNVQNHFAKMDVRVPKVNSVSPELGIVLLEDLGDLTLERKFWENQNQQAAMPFYEQSVDELIKIHFLASKPVTPASICQQIAFDTAKFMWEMNYAREHFLDNLGQVKLSDKDQKALQAEFLQICETLDREPKFVCHRDYHSRNLMLKLGRIYVIDFQDARLGPLQYDLVSLLHDSYVNLSQESIQSLKDDYKAKARKVCERDPILGNFEEIFQIQLIQRCFKACGSFASFFNARNDTRYLKYIRSTANLVGQTLDETGQAKLFSRVLNDSGLRERNYDELCAV